MNQMQTIIYAISYAFAIYLVIYATYLLCSVIVGALALNKEKQMRAIQNELKHNFYFPISILVPAYNEEVTIIETVTSLLHLEYHLYEIIVIDDGSQDNTSNLLIENFEMNAVHRPTRMKIPCQPVETVFETTIGKTKLTLIRKKNGGKGDALNMGINAASNPYVLCMDADSMLQKDSLVNIVKPLLEDDSIVAIGGMIQIAQCVTMKDGMITKYRMPNNPIVGMQVMEYMRSFLTSRILLDRFNGNLIISGAFGLFKKNIVIAVGGYDTDTLGEDMELVAKLHRYCRKNRIKYSIRYEPNAICWSQAPSRLRDIKAQRTRWHLGLLQCMVKYRDMFFNLSYGLLSFISYMYYLLFELMTPFIEVFGFALILFAYHMDILNVSYMIQFFLLYGFYGFVLTLTAFIQRIYISNTRLNFFDILKSIVFAIFEVLVFRYLLLFFRIFATFRYGKKKKQWGNIRRSKQNSEP